MSISYSRHLEIQISGKPVYLIVHGLNLKCEKLILTVTLRPNTEKFCSTRYKNVIYLKYSTINHTNLIKCVETLE